MCLTYGSIAHNSYFPLLGRHVVAYTNWKAVRIFSGSWCIIQLKPANKRRLCNYPAYPPLAFISVSELYHGDNESASYLTSERERERERLQKMQCSPRRRHCANQPGDRRRLRHIYIYLRNDNRAARYIFLFLIRARETFFARDTHGRYSDRKINNLTSDIVSVAISWYIHAVHEPDRWWMGDLVRKRYDATKWEWEKERRGERMYRHVCRKCVLHRCVTPLGLRGGEVRTFFPDERARHRRHLRALVPEEKSRSQLRTVWCTYYGRTRMYARGTKGEGKENRERGEAGKTEGKRARDDVNDVYTTRRHVMPSRPAAGTSGWRVRHSRLTVRRPPREGGTKIELD